jgi:hypothetical protein
MIAFRAGEDPELIDAVFRQSALYRDKWEREDYRSQTIERGIEASRCRCSAKEEPPKKAAKKKPPDFIKVDEKKKQEFNLGRSRRLLRYRHQQTAGNYQ